MQNLWSSVFTIFPPSLIAQLLLEKLGSWISRSFYVSQIRVLTIVDRITWNYPSSHHRGRFGIIGTETRNPQSCSGTLAREYWFSRLWIIIWGRSWVSESKADSHSYHDSWSAILIRESSPGQSEEVFLIVTKLSAVLSESQEYHLFYEIMTQRWLLANTQPHKFHSNKNTEFTL